MINNDLILETYQKIVNDGCRRVFHCPKCNQLPSLRSQVFKKTNVFIIACTSCGLMDHNISTFPEEAWAQWECSCMEMYEDIGFALEQKDGAIHIYHPEADGEFFRYLPHQEQFPRLRDRHGYLNLY